MAGSTHVILGTGTIGTALAVELLGRGLQVRTVSRSGGPDLDGAERLRGDLEEPDFAAASGAGAAAVYQCLNPPYHQWPERFPGLQRAAIAAARHDGARLVSFENVYAYGDTGGSPITEDLPLNASTKKGRVRADMANELADLHARGEVEVATARASDYFGPGATVQSQLGERVIGRALAGKSAQVIGDPSTRHSYTYAPDAARVLATLGTDDRASGHVWHVPNAPARPTTEIIDMIGTELGRDIKVSPAPKLVLRLMGLFNPVVRELDEMLYEFEQPFIVDGSKFEDEFGMKATPMDAAVRETVAWWRSRS